MMQEFEKLVAVCLAMYSIVRFAQGYTQKDAAKIAFYGILVVLLAVKFA